MHNTTDYQNALKAYQRDVYDIKRQSAIKIQDAYRKHQDYLYDYTNFWTRSRIPDSAFDVNITWRDLWLALRESHTG